MLQIRYRKGIAARVSNDFWGILLSLNFFFEQDMEETCWKLGKNFFDFWIDMKMEKLTRRR